MQLLKLSNDLDARVLVDDEDYAEVSKHRWHRSPSGSISRNYKRNNKTYRVSLAQAVMQNRLLMYDHIDRNPFNNCKGNLRPVTVSQNQMNSTKQKGKSSSYKGVGWCKATKKWCARVKIDNKVTYLGYFTLETDAAKAYNDKAVELFGKFANLNVIL